VLPPRFLRCREDLADCGAREDFRVIDQASLRGQGIGPVSLEERIRFHREVYAGDQVDVSCVFVWGEGKTFRVEQEIRTPDGTLAAEVTNVGGLLDLTQRRLINDPGRIWRSAASTPELLGLA